MKSVLSAFVAFLFIGTATAQHQKDIQDVIDVNDVVVTATKTPKMLKDVPILTRVISAGSIKKMGVSTIQEVLSSEMAGLEFNQAGYGNTMSFQGLDARYVLILVDGERLAGETYGNIDYERIPLDNIERIEIVKGASSVLYGSNAMGAVINIITKNPKKKVEAGGSIRYAGYNDRDFKQKTALEQSQTQAAKDNFDKYQRKMDVPNLSANAYLGLKLGKLTSLTEVGYKGVDAYMMHSSEYQSRLYKEGAKVTKVVGGRPTTSTLPANTTIIDSTGYSNLSISGWQMFNINQRFTYQFSDKVSMKVSGGYYWKNRYNFRDTDGGISTGMESGEPWAFEHYSSYNVKGELNYKINEKNNISFSLMTDIYNRGMDSMDVLTPKQRHGYFIPRVLWTNTPNKINRITAGVELSKEFLNFDLNAAGYDDRKTYNIFSIYAQDEIQATKDLSIVAGLRLDSWGFADAVEAFTNFVGKFGQAKVGRGLSATPKLAVTYNLGEFTFRANYARGFRTPSLKELYMEYYQPTMAMTIKGNPNLIPEKNDYLSASVEYTSPVFNTSANGYASFFKNKIDVYQNESKELIYNNTHKSRYYGFEWMGRVKLLRGWWLKANYNYVHEDKSASTSSNMTQYIYVSPHTAVLQTDYSFNWGRFDIGLNVSGKYIGAKEYDDRIPYVTQKPMPGGPPNVTIVQGIYTINLDGYTMWNAAASLTFDRKMTLTLGVDNLFNYVPAIVGFNSTMTPGSIGYARMMVSF